MKIHIYNEYITLSHGMNNKPLHRVHHKIVDFNNRHKIEGFQYHSGFISSKDNVTHKALVTRLCPVILPQDNHFTKPNETIWSVTNHHKNKRNIKGKEC